MIKLLILLACACAAAILGPSLADNQGLVHIVIGDYVVEMSVTTFVIVLIIAFIAVNLIMGIINRCLKFPAGTVKLIKNRHDKKASDLQDQAFLAYERGDYSISMNLLKKLGPIQSMQLKALLLLSKAAFRAGNYDLTREAISEAENRGEQSQITAAMVRAKLNYRVGNTKEALIYLDKLRPVVKNKFIYTLYYKCYQREGLLDKLNELSAAFEKYEVASKEELLKNRLNFIKSKINRAQTLPELEAILTMLGRSEKKEAQFMAPYFAKMVKLGGKDEAKNAVLGFLKNNLDPLMLESIALWEESISAVMIFLKDKSTSSLDGKAACQLLKALSNLEFRAGLYDEALSDCQKALTMADTTDLYILAANILDAKKRYEEADGYYKLALDPVSDDKVARL